MVNHVAALLCLALLACSSAPATSASAPTSTPKSTFVTQPQPTPTNKPTQPTVRPATALQFVTDIREQIIAHDWTTLLDNCDPSHRSEQLRKLGMRKAQYVAEMLGLHNRGNNITRANQVEFADLERIVDVVITSLSDTQGNVTVRGHVKLKDGTTLVLSLSAHRTNGRLYLIAAVG